MPRKKKTEEPDEEQNRKALDDVATLRCPEPLCNGTRESPQWISLGPGQGTICKHPFHKLPRGTKNGPSSASPIGQVHESLGIAESPVIASASNITRPANAMPLLKADTREKLLYKIACTGTPLGAEFFDNFTDMKEVLELALSISVRLCVVAICNSELAPTQRISAMRLVAALNGKQLPSEEDSTINKPAPPYSIPTGSKEDVTRTLEAIKRGSC